MCNEEIWKRTGMNNIVLEVKRRRWTWLGHVLRMKKGPASARGVVLGAPWEEAPGQTTRHLAEDHRGRDGNSWKDVERAAVAGPGPV